MSILVRTFDFELLNIFQGVTECPELPDSADRTWRYYLVYLQILNDFRVRVTYVFQLL